MDNDLLHRAVAAIKDLALELGKVPTKAEFVSRVSGAEGMLRRSGGMTVLLKAAGLDTYEDRRGTKKQKITNQVFEVSLEAHLERHEPRERSTKTVWPKIAIMGDLHEPFSHKACKQAFIEFCAEFQPEYIVQIGDAVDFLAHSKWPASKNIYKPKEEEEIARRALEDFWKQLGEKCPKAKRVMLLGNHAVRPLKRILEAVPSMEHWAEKYLEAYLAFPGVETVMDTREEYLIADIAFIHGHASQLGQHRDHLLRNVVCGHTHRGGAVFRNFRQETMFELNAGHCADEDSKAMTYTPTKTTGWTLGWAAIDKHGPRFIPFY